jgi:exopolyphosphatase/guanosine-5'-triphosphate,3'-diphosphate pyrophosphatase
MYSSGCERPEMKKAVIDLGTNTFNLIIGTVSNGKLKLEHTEKEAVMLGMNGINNRTIAPDALERAQQTLTHFCEITQNYGVETILGMGTSAMREANNAEVLINWAKDTLNLKIKIISGDDEAAYIYKGVALLHDFDTPAMIMDIGGGSNEFILADSRGVIAAQSFDIGVSRLYQLLGKPDHFTVEHRAELDQMFERETQNFFKGRKVNHLIGASGSFETVFEMIHKQRYPEHQQCIEDLPFEKMGDALHWAVNSTLQERLEHPWIVPMRKKMLPLAAYSILWVLEQIEAKKVSICPYSLKEGVLAG